MGSMPTLLESGMPKLIPTTTEPDTTTPRSGGSFQRILEPTGIYTFGPGYGVIPREPTEGCGEMAL
jgi:hypothetical protein